MSDVVWNAIIAGVVTIVLAIINHRLGKIAETGEKTHTLVNSNMGVQLRLHAVTSRRLADVLNTPETEEIAQLAAKMLEEHESKQATVDAGGKS